VPRAVTTPSPGGFLKCGFLLLKDVPNLAIGDAVSGTCVKRQGQLKNT
jgi:hypothetical protein